MRPSILRQVLFAYLGLGAVVAGIFPVYAGFFVEWKPGMLPWFVAGCFVAGLFIGVANYWVMHLVLISRLRRISQVAGAIAGRDLSFTCTMQSHDTIGEIIKSFNDMAATLRELITQASSLSSQVRDDSDALRGQAGEIHARVDRLAERNRLIAASMGELENSIANIGQQVEHASRQAAEADNTASTGVGVAQETITGMEHIHDRVSSATERVERLARSSQEVGSIVAVIKEIADQTNLLALNAAIEAARAGEQGRGFAVVADEVRKLAEKTTEATGQIGQMIDTIQGETAQAIEAIGESMTEARQGVDLARRAGDALARIIQVVREVDALIGEIARTTASQKSVARSVHENVTAIEALNSQTLADSEQGMSLTDRLARDANHLDEAVKSFRL